MGRACPPLLPSARVRAGGPVEGGVWSGRDVAADVKSQDWPGDQDQAAFLSLGSGWCSASSEAGRSAKWGDRQAQAQRWEPRGQEPKLEGQVTWTSGPPGREGRAGSLRDGEHRFGGAGTGGPPRDPVDLLTSVFDPL